jgi:two-component system sensor histidine kinase PilS (NtrC family)
MPAIAEKTIPFHKDEFQTAQSLVLGRLIVIFLLLATSWVWYSGGLEISFNSFPQGPLLVFIIAIGLTAVYFLLLRISKHVEWQITAQLILDSLLVTWLVWKTGDLTSPYITLYIVVIGVSSLYFKPTATLIMAFACTVLFTGTAVLAYLELIDSIGQPQSTRKVIQIISFHIIAFTVVGYLASKLSERRFSGEQLQLAARSLANLRAVHERIVESIRSGLITTDLEGNIFTFNAAAAEITGYSADQMKGRTIFSLFGDIREPIELSFAARNESEQLPRFEADLTTPDGFAVRIGYSISQLYSETNEVSGLIISFQDLTEIRSMEESVRRKDRLAAVGRVGAGLAHEIRNPLGAMRGAIQVLQSSTPPESIQSDLMDIILRESDRLNNIITNFLSYARPKAGNFTDIDLCEAIRDTLTLLRHSPDVKETHVLTEKLPDKPVFVSADAAQLKQVFWNLARNAIHAMPDGGTLKVSTETVPNNRTRIIFEDTGQGMTPEQVERLFEPFSNSTTGGTGLGLSIVYQIIRDHNGTINVRSLEEEGTMITIEIPRDNRSASQETRPADSSATSSRLGTYLNVRAEESKISS